MKELNDNPIEPSIVFIPDYIVNNLNTYNVGLDKLNSLVHMGYEVDESIKKNIANISYIDIKSMLTLNHVMYTNLLGVHNINNTFDKPSSISSIYSFLDRFCYKHIGTNITMDDELDIVNLYLNTNIDSLSVLMSDNSNKLFDCVVHDNTVFVIVHEGFTNFIANNDKVFKNHLTKSLMDYMFNSLESGRVLKSTIFKKFISLYKV